ncbi:hypothetical protein [Metaclostridioides mangenotii]|uniref:hypothetical protein n=1 Tax=Metaclostridioides mangenotii TaxID=1540 RepID=UPI000485ACC5|nr:hypothetical protein [Clostridioides mangenotii]
MYVADDFDILNNDKVDIYRKQKVINEVTGATEVKIGDKPIFENIKCGVSKKDTYVDINGIGKLVKVTELFCRPDIDIKTGDELRVTYEHREEAVFTAGKPDIYSGSHLEVIITQKERV